MTRRTYALHILTALVFVLGGCIESERLHAAQGREREETFPTWEEFLASARYLESSGVYVANGDETFESIDELRAYYDARVGGQAIGTQRSSLLLDWKDDGQRNAWSESEKRQIGYCVVSGAVSPHYELVVNALHDAAAKWGGAADVEFIHLSQFDDNCTASRPGVKFIVKGMDDIENPCGPGADREEVVENPPDGSGGTCTYSRIIARAPFPDQTDRSLEISMYYLANDPQKAIGSIIHELGHVLGFRHEHIRLQQTSSFCSELSTGWEALTAYDPDSVMNYGGSCGGNRNRAELSTLDMEGARELYGMPPVLTSWMASAAQW